MGKSKHKKHHKEEYDQQGVVPKLIVKLGSTPERSESPAMIGQQGLVYSGM